MAKIKLFLIKNEPESYQAFLYRWTNLTNGRIYIGYHTGFVGDGYKHSGECKEFNEDFQNLSYEWKYEILEFGTTNEMKNLERDMLKSVEARNNKLYYNQTNGGSAYKHTNPITSAELVENILSGKYLAKDEFGNPLQLGKDKFKSLLESRIQVRGVELVDSVNHIADEIDEVGDTQNCNPITLLENRISQGVHQLLDGSTTMMGTTKSKHGLYLRYNLIPYDIHSKFSEYDLRGIGFQLNPKQKQKKWESDDDDLTNHIMRGFELNKIPINSKENRDFLKRVGCNGRKISYIFKKCERLKTLGTYQSVGTPWISYKLPQHISKLEQRIKEIEKNVASTKVFCFSSEKYRWEDIVIFLLNNNKAKNKIKNISVIIHHPFPDSEVKWNINLIKIQSYMDGLISQFQLNFLGFEYMPKY